MLTKSFDHATVEADLYAGWEASGAFQAGNSDGAPFTIMIPPPNVTGSLHMGHALTFTVQDISGAVAPHAGPRRPLATRHRPRRHRHPDGRRAPPRHRSRQTARKDHRPATRFLERVWQWKAESGGTITHQLRRLGASLDWPRERFTMDDGLSAAVRKESSSPSTTRA